MSRSAMLQAIATNVQAALPSLRACNVHDGQFSDRDLARYMGIAPAVYVSCLGSTDSEDQGDDLAAISQWVMVVVTRRAHHETESASRTMSALDLTDALMFAVRNNGFPGHSWAPYVNGPAEKLRSRNLFNESADERGATIWLVAWEQAVSIGAFPLGPLDDFLRATTTFELTDSTGTHTTESEFTATVQTPPEPTP